MKRKNQNNADGPLPWFRYVIVPIIVALIGSGTFIFYTNVIQNQTKIINSNPTPISSEERIVATDNPDTVEVCPGLQRTGMNQQMTLDIDVPAGYVQYLGGTRFDDAGDGVIITVTGSYQGQHVLYQGAFCEPVIAGSPEDTAAREQIEREVAYGGAECPEWCPTEVPLP